MKQGTEEWIEYRRSKIGASDASIIMGLSPYKTPFQLWMEKVHDVKPEMNHAMWYGRDNEEKARKLFEEMTNLVVFGNLAPVVNQNFDWQIASLDGITPEGDIIVEIKCANAKDHAVAKEGRVPEKYIPQLQHQLCVTGLAWMYYFSFHKGEGEVVIVKRDDPYIEEILRAEKIFYMDHMVGKIPPEMVDKDLKS